MGEVQDLFRNQREEWLEECRAAARRLLASKPEITIEDVLAECPRPSYVHRNTTGRVFKSPEFMQAGWAQARKLSSKGRWIMKWTLRWSNDH